MNYLLDTNICSALLEGDTELNRQLRVQKSSDFFLCSIVKAELIFGARKSSRVAANIKLLDEFFPRFVSLPFDDSAAEYYGLMRTSLSKAGTPIGANDLFIASIALANDLTILTRNRNEFFRVPALRVETW